MHRGTPSPNTSLPAVKDNRSAINLLHRPSRSHHDANTTKTDSPFPPAISGGGHSHLPAVGRPFATKSPTLAQQQRFQYILTPSVSVTPEVMTLETDQYSLWAAIEISGDLWPISDGHSHWDPGQKQPDLRRNSWEHGQQSKQEQEHTCGEIT